jgi:hypothetical protein
MRRNSGRKRFLGLKFRKMSEKDLHTRDIKGL